jgi:hypothetical protein
MSAEDYIPSDFNDGGEDDWKSEPDRLILVTGDKVFGFRVALDAKMPRNRVDFVDSEGEIVGRIINLAAPLPSTVPRND